ncbi:MAG: hypothetical protein M3N93_09665, partial [Acidobacteriota bacterium]|nr:hypothetical protein [Acidobacteriota bacterium]
GEPFRLDAGDFRWVPLNVRQTPSEVDCYFEVLKGSPTVHIELLPLGEFRFFDRGRPHDTLAATPDGRTGEFRRVVDARGQYAVVIENARRAPPATVRLRVETNLNPGTDLARTLPPGRRLAVVLISFGVFFTTLAWSGRKLLRAARATPDTTSENPPAL